MDLLFHQKERETSEKERRRGRRENFDVSISRRKLLLLGIFPR